jgi:23S rRNA-/tRNA-specific pseudouridylate synthase
VPPLSLLQVTPHEIVVCKPPGLASELPRDPHAESLLTRLHADGYDDLRLVHRLDAPTCGVMVVARTADAAAHYAAEIAAQRWKKFYVAEIGLPADRAHALLGDHKAYLSTQGRRARVVRSGGKPSFLSVVHAASAGPARTHLLIRLHTGRFHQIRVMLAALGAPLTGDRLYGGGEGAMYLEHVLLGAHPFGDPSLSVWRAPAHSGRPAWPASLIAAVNEQQTLILREA